MDGIVVEDDVGGLVGRRWASSIETDELLNSCERPASALLLEAQVFS